MANNTLRIAGPTTFIAVTATSSTSVTVTPTTPDNVSFASFLNVGTKACAVNISSLATAPAAVFPAAGTPGNFVLPASMLVPVVLAVPQTKFSVTAICGGTDTTTLLVTPVENQ